MTDRSGTPCRALVGGFGTPGLRDLDFGRQLVAWLEELDWPDGVVVEDLSCSAPLVLHRLQELRPPKVVLVGAVARELDPPGTLRRYRVDPAPTRPAELQRQVEESVMGMVDLDHTLAMARHWGGLPVDTVVIEVEPAETGCGPGFSEVLAACLDPILDLVREELAGVGPEDPSGAEELLGPADAGPAPAEVCDDLVDLVGYAADHAQARRQSLRAPALLDRLPAGVPGVALAGRVRPWGVFVDSGGDWFDMIPLADERLGIVVGNVAGRGVEAAPAMSDLRAAARAYAVLDTDSPGRLLGRLDGLAEATGLGQDARVLYVVVQPGTGEVRFSSAGGCPPLLLDAERSGPTFLTGGRSSPVGAQPGGDRPEACFRLVPGSTVLLFTDGLVESRSVSRSAGLERLRQVAARARGPVDELCDHVLDLCADGLRRDDDICLVGVGLAAPAVARGAISSRRARAAP